MDAFAGVFRLRHQAAIRHGVAGRHHSGDRHAYFTTNIEDGIALADEALREEIAARYPEAWSRIEARRAFMADVLGIRLKPEVLPFSNIPAFLPPFWLSRNSAMAVTRR